MSTREREHPTHCIKGHPAMWCTCERFVAAPNGRFNTFPMIAYPRGEES